MILLMDVGNSNIKIGLATEETKVKTWRIATDSNKTADEFGMVLRDLLLQEGYSFSDVTGIIMSSVVPSINYTLEHMCTYYMHTKPIMVSESVDLGGLKIEYKSELGSDRILNAVAAYKKYGGPIITVDFGTATTFGAVTADGTFKGGLIFPGLKQATASLSNNAAKLPKIEIVRPSDVLSDNTVGNMQAGIFYGYEGMLYHIVDLIRSEPDFNNAKVIATGGLSEIFLNRSNEFALVDRGLSLDGLLYLYKCNQNK